MTPTDTTVSKEKARADLEDIGTLKNTDAFERYWLRRLKQKRDAVEKSFKEDPPSKVDATERECLRRILGIYNELLGMCAVDEGNIRRDMPQSPAMRI